MLKSKISSKLSALVILIGLLLGLSACGYPSPQGGGKLDGYVIIVTPTPLPAQATALADATALARATATPQPTATAAITSTPAPAVTAAAPKTTPTLGVVNDTYTIQEGDTLLGIAIRFNVDFDELVSVNNITEPNKLQVGQKLKLPKRQVNAPTATPKR